MGFKDAISEAIQTIKAADTAFTGIKSLIASAKALAEDAKGQVGASNLTQTLKLGTIAAGSTVSIGGVTFTARDTAGAQQVDTDFKVGATDAATAFNLRRSSTSMPATQPNLTQRLPAIPSPVTSRTAGTAMTATEYCGHIYRLH